MARFLVCLFHFASIHSYSANVTVRFRIKTTRFIYPSKHGGKIIRTAGQKYSMRFDSLTGANECNITQLRTIKEILKYIYYKIIYLNFKIQKQKQNKFSTERLTLIREARKCSCVWDRYTNELSHESGRGRLPFSDNQL